MKRKLLCGLPMALFLISLTACGNSQAVQPKEPTSVPPAAQTEASPIDFSKTVISEPTVFAEKAVEPSYGSHPGSSDYSRLFVTDGQFFYYISGSSKIIKQSIQDGSKSVLYQDVIDSSKYFENLTIVNGWLYFTSREHTQEGGFLDQDVWICRIRTDGTEYGELYKTHCVRTGRIDDMLIVDSTIYFTLRPAGNDEKSLMSMNLDGSNITELLKGGFQHISISGHQLALLDNTITKSIVFYDIDTGKSQTKEIPGAIVNNLQAAPSGKFYYYDSPTLTTPERIYQYSPATESIEEFDTAYD